MYIKTKKYTAFIPRTVKATKNTSRKFVKRMNFYIKNSTRRLKKVPQLLDKRIAKSIHSLTKRHHK